ncbi:LysM peptidoglycan-binding domain-containing protein [Cytobacillus massiliigabonensis]|uniref:LysM peptidoglycan-binding domain-containing protein n=1 Tax=Cytobacillus massiliigabonensis TaxID=1871011 RepID=UPI000C846950|nr:LysM peptidoglycan-binding domain-containing protein [Cytobacillus massiliigabonensis]
MRMKLQFTLPFIFYFSFNTAANAQSNYVVMEGDTLWNIAIHHQISLERIIHSNLQLQNPNLIYPGQVIVIPSVEWNDRHEKNLSKEEAKLADLLNAKRIQFGMKPLIIDDSLTRAARIKSADMIEHRYISHHSPTYGSPASMLNKLNIPYQIVKESIGAGYQSAELVLSTWLHSSVNRESILNDRATKIGIGYAEGGLYNHYWTILITGN